MTTVIWLLAALIIAAAIIYIFFPQWLFQVARNMQRRRGGMVLKSVRVGDLTWPYLEGGDPNGVAVVLVHGFGGDKDNWSFYAPYLTKNYRLICPDLPGFGDNDRSLELDHSMSVQAARLRDFLDALGIGTCHLGGNSMGGFIALRFAIDFPDRLRSLTLFNNAGVVGTDQSELEKMAVDGESPLVMRTLSDVDRLMGFIAHKPRFIPRQFKKVALQQTKPHEALLDKIFWQIVGDAQERALNGELDKVMTPTQIIWGRHDRLIDVSCATVQHNGIKDSELVIFEDAGHVPMIEKPAEAARQNLAFLAKH